MTITDKGSDKVTLSHSDKLQRPLMMGVLLLLLGWWWHTDVFAHEVLAEIFIFAILAMSLDVLVGYVGMVSLGHAAFMAAGAYTTAGLATLLNWPVSLASLCAIVVAALLSLLVGSFAVQLRGIYFIMITMSIGQMVYSFLFKARYFGGDNGMSGTPRMDVSWLGLDSQDPATFALMMMFAMVFVYVFLRFIVCSHFGALLIGIRLQEKRLRALGLPIWHYKLAAFTISGGVAGFAGALLVQHTGFVSPDLAFWTVSGEVLIMIIVGGMGSLIGALLGAVVLIQLRYTLSDGSFWEGIGLATEIAEFWQLMLGLFFIAVVLMAEDGIYGRLRRLGEGWQRSHRQRHLTR